MAPNRSVFVAYIAYRDNNQVVEWLEFLQSFKHTSMTKPYNVKLLGNKVFVLSNIDNPCLYVFSQSDEKLRSLMHVINKLSTLLK